MIIYDGSSLINGKPIVVIAIPDSNPKIRTMLCTWILDQEVSPEVAALSGADYSICGDCKFRAAVGTARKLADTNRQLELHHCQGEEMPFPRILEFESLVDRRNELKKEAEQSRTCYVRLTSDGSDGHPPADEKMPPKDVWDAWKAGAFSPASNQDYVKFFEGDSLLFPWILDDDENYNYIGDFTVRIGSYGDPAAVPIDVWKALIKDARNWTGYTHQWRPRECEVCRGRGYLFDFSAGLTMQQRSSDCAKCNGSGQTQSCDPELKTICMASVDTYKEKLEAEKLGWRAFIVLPEEAVKTSYVQNVQLANSVKCPMTAGKNVTCDKCHMCKGTSSPVKQHIHEIIHGVNRSNHSEW